MKNITGITMLIAVAAALFSCSKKETAPVSAPVQSPIVPVVKEREINSVSKWVTLPLRIATDRQSYWLEGTYTLPDAAGYNYSTHKQFVFSRSKGRDSYVYNSLPFRVPTVDGELDFNYAVTENGFIVKIMNNNYPARKPSFQNSYVVSSTFRFLVISDSTFRTHPIDWTNYEEVARALGPTIWFE